MEELLMYNLIGNLVGSIFGGAVGLFSNERNIDYQESANEQNIAIQKEINAQNIAFQREVNAQNIQNQWDMWNATNEYNTPANQMARFKAAGLNPHLIYGQSNSTNPVSIPSMGTPEIQAPQIKAPKSNLGALQEMFEKLSKIPIINEQLSLIHSNAEIAAEKAKQEKINTTIADQYKTDLAKYDWFAKDVDYNILVEYAKELGLIGDKPTNVLSDIIQGRIDSETMPTKRQRLINTQIVLNKVLKEIKDIENLNMSDYWDQRIKAMQIANEIKTIDLDWQEFDKELAASSGITKIILMLIKNMVK